MGLRAKQRWHREARKFFNYIKDEYDVEKISIGTLNGTAENLSIYNIAADDIKKNGITYTTNTGQIKKNPACQIAKESWSGFLQGLKALGLYEYKDMGRPPGK